MAKPPTSDPQLPLFYNPSDDHMDDSDISVHNPRKRARRSSESDESSSMHYDWTDDGRPKTRRVNPQRLAVRLGPDLVAEMEALIMPGAKMPNFTIRKDFQERYNVDRRHIYDYFHSRGLRVAKEDKHSNLTRGRAAKALQQQQQQQQQQLELQASARKEADEANTSLLTQDCTNYKATLFSITRRPTKVSQGKKPRKAPVVKSTFSGPDVCSRGKKILRTSTKKRALAVIDTNADNKSDPLNDPIRRSSTPPTNIEDLPTEDSTTDVPFIEDSLRVPPIKELCPDIWTCYVEELEFFHSLVDFSELESGQDIMQASCYMSLADEHSLTQKERYEIYTMIDANIPSSQGIEESTGTYFSYMKERSWLYFDRIIQNSRTVAGIPERRNPSERASLFPEDSTDPGNDDYNLRKWLSFDNKTQGSNTGSQIGSDIQLLGSRNPVEATPEPAKPISDFVLPPTTVNCDVLDILIQKHDHTNKPPQLRDCFETPKNYPKSELALKDFKSVPSVILDAMMRDRPCLHRALSISSPHTRMRSSSARGGI